MSADRNPLYKAVHERIAAEKTETERLLQQLQTVCRELYATQGQLQKSEEHIERLQEEKNNLERRIEQLLEENNSLQHRLDDANAKVHQLEDTQERLNKLQAEHEETLRAVATSKKTNEELREKLKERDRELKRLNEQLDSMTRAVDALERQRRTEGKALEAQVRYSEEMRQRYMSLSKELKKKDVALKKAVADAEKAMAEAAELRKQVEKEDTWKQIKDDQLQDTDVLVKRLRKERARLVKQLQDETERSHKRELAMGDVLHENASLKSQLAILLHYQSANNEGFNSYRTWVQSQRQRHHRHHQQQYYDSNKTMGQAVGEEESERAVYPTTSTYEPLTATAGLINNDPSLCQSVHGFVCREDDINALRRENSKTLQTLQDSVEFLRSSIGFSSNAAAAMQQKER